MGLDTQEDLPPFAIAMADFLAESGKRASRPAIVQNMMTATNAKYEEDKRIMMQVVEESMYMPKYFACGILTFCSLHASHREPSCQSARKARCPEHYVEWA